MFETLPNSSMDIAFIVLRALLLFGALWVFALAFIRWRRQDEANHRRLEQRLDRAFNELRSLHETVTVMNARLESMSERSDVGARLAPSGPTTSQRGYDVATRLAKNGASIDELTTNCGITRHEAELLVRLHGAKRGNGEAAIGRLKQQAQESVRPEQAHWTAAPRSEPQRQPAPPAVRKRGSLVSVVG